MMMNWCEKTYLHILHEYASKSTIFKKTYQYQIHDNTKIDDRSIKKKKQNKIQNLGNKQSLKHEQ